MGGLYRIAGGWLGWDVQGQRQAAWQPPSPAGWSAYDPSLWEGLAKWQGGHIHNVAFREQTVHKYILTTDHNNARTPSSLPASVPWDPRIRSAMVAYITFSLSGNVGRRWLEGMLWLKLKVYEGKVSGRG